MGLIQHQMDKLTGPSYNQTRHNLDTGTIDVAIRNQGHKTIITIELEAIPNNSFFQLRWAGC